MRTLLKGGMMLVVFFMLGVNGYAAINMTVSPIKYEIEVNPWESIIKTATLYNYDATPIDIVTWKSDFTSNWTTWAPSFVRYSELVHADQQLSSWISLSSSGFTIPANDSVTIDFTLNIPESATPGWHYWAVFFKNNNSESTSGTKISINADYWILILLTVSWEVNTVIEVEEPIVSDNSSNSNNSSSGGGNSSWWSTSAWWYSSATSGSSNLTSNSNSSWNWNGFSSNGGTDNCLIDFTNSNFDWLCYDNPADVIPAVSNFVSQLWWSTIVADSDSIVNNSNVPKDISLLNVDSSNNNTDTVVSNVNNLDSSDNNNLDSSDNNNNNNNNNNNIELVTGTQIWSEPNEDWNNSTEKLDVTFTFPIKNTWNTHVKPTWKITLIDENGEQIWGVWKKSKLNDKWAVIWVEIVDYLPINDWWWNVLPQSVRNFEETWQGFPYQTLDVDWKIVVKNMSPDEYYTKQNISGDTVLMPWERICYRKNNTTVKALIDIVYTDDNWEDVEYSSAKDIPITYTEKYVWVNPYIVVPFFLFFWIFFLLWFIALGKRTRCVNKDCKKRIKRKLLRCPHCDTKQKKSDSKKKSKKKK